MRKDYVSTFDGTLASLSAPTRLIYLLILKRKAHKDNKYCKKDQFFHSVENISEASGYKTRAVKYALKELRDLEVIDWTERPGRSTLYTHKKYITIYTPKNYTNEKYTPENPRISCTPANTSIPCTPPMHQVHPTYAPHAPITTKDLTNKDLTTTDWLSDKLLDRLIKEYTIEAINERVVAIKKGNGNFYRKAGLLVDSLKRGYIPTCPEIRKTEQKEKHKKYVDEQIEKNRLEQEERERLFVERDPELPNRLLADFNKKYKA